jgi:hypothetical protein
LSDSDAGAQREDAEACEDLLGGFHMGDLVVGWDRQAGSTTTGSKGFKE